MNSVLNLAMSHAWAHNHVEQQELVCDDTECDTKRVGDMKSTEWRSLIRRSGSGRSGVGSLTALPRGAGPLLSHLH